MRLGQRALLGIGSQYQVLSSHKITQKWKNYRYRFVPWLMLKLKTSGVRTVTEYSTDEPQLSQEEFTDFLVKYLEKLHSKLLKSKCPDMRHSLGAQVQEEMSGFRIARQPSDLKDGGLGVKVTSGSVPAGHVTSLYPGLLYEPHDPIFFQSIGNQFIFRCADGLLIDGNDKGLSQSLFKSCRGRDSLWPLPACDSSWLTPQVHCPLNLGQYVNNHTEEFPANVVYQEFDIPNNFPFALRQYLPNNFYAPSCHIDYGPNTPNRILRVVVLISLREIFTTEELFSSYFTLVR